ncbi:DinB family protein [Pedobacter immunditicola]|uniref:DinB family protein n=1 Tax=Pedobacter immunditicola TaxID=3133440 RepID=UPI0030AD6271
MEMIKIFLEDLNQEAVTTRKMLERIPDDQFNYKPHEKSMVMKSLATHIAELPTWITMTLTTTELDFATAPYTVPEINANAELLAYFEKNLEDGRSQLLPENEAHLLEPWTLRNGEEIYSTSPKYSVIRMALNQIVHHRAQLGVYLRLLNIPIPGSYGPSADETGF